MAWINVPKPTDASIVSVGGSAQPWGLLLAITSVTGGGQTSIISGWTDISKPTSPNWISVAKPINSIWSLIAKPTS